MTRIEKQVVIGRPLNEVLAFARDWRNIPKYFDYIQTVKPLTDKTDRPGAKLLVNLTFMGRKMTSEWEVMEYDAAKGWTVKTPLMGIEPTKTWSFVPAGETTRTSFTLEYEPAPPVIGPLVDGLLLRRKWDKLCEQGMLNLKRIIEAEPTK